MLHDTRNQNVLAVTYSVYLNLFAHQVFIYQDRMILRDLVNDSNVFFYILIADCNTHSLSAKNIGRTYQNRISQSVSNFFCFLSSKYSISLRSRDLALLQDTVKQLTVLCCIYVFCRCSENLHAHFHQRFCQLDGSLSAELNDRSVRFFDFYDIFYILRCQRLEIQLVCNIKVCADSLRIVVDNNCLVAFFFKSPGTVYRAEVKLNTLADTDRT